MSKLNLFAQKQNKKYLISVSIEKMETSIKYDFYYKKLNLLKQFSRMITYY